MKKPVLGYLFLFLIFTAFVYSAFIQKETISTFEALPIIAGAASGVALWFWMAVNFFRNRRKLKHPFIWGLFFVIANWITAIIYFLVKYIPTEKTDSPKRIVNWLNKGNRTGYFLKLAFLCLIITKVHNFIMITLYTSIGLHNNELYYLIFVKTIYYPLSALLTTTYKALSIDTENPTNNLIMVGRTLNFIYTYLLFYLSAIVILHFQNKRNQSVSA